MADHREIPPALSFRKLHQNRQQRIVVTLLLAERNRLNLAPDIL